MKFDKRIDKDYKIYSCFDAEQAQEYINTKGYFTDYYENFEDIKNLFYNTLKKINNSTVFPYSNTERKESFKFFLPEKFVKNKEEPKEKKYRPYILNEFLTVFTIGQPIRYRQKKGKCNRSLVFNGYEIYEDKQNIILIGVHAYTLEELFKNYEWQKFPEKEYKPFGVEE